MAEKQAATTEQHQRDHSPQGLDRQTESTFQTRLSRMRMISQLMRQLSPDDRDRLRQRFIAETSGPLAGKAVPEARHDGVDEDTPTDVSTDALADPCAIRLFDLADAKRRLKKAGTANDKKDEQEIIKRMIASGGMARLRPVPEQFDTIMDEMDAQYPHFAAVTQFLRQRMTFALAGDAPALRFGANILLNGPAGVGKSSYLMMLSERLGTAFASFSCAAVSNGFDLVGLSAGWGTGKPGKLHDLLVEQACPNPIILLDEVEKAVRDDKGNFAGTLFGLLEKNNARTFADEFIDVKMDASHINWFATSNDASRLDPAIADRFTILDVRTPDEAQLKAMMPQIYHGLIEEHRLHKAFSDCLPDTVIDMLAGSDGVSIRKVKRRIEAAMACSLQGRNAQQKRQLRLRDFSETPGTSANEPEKRRPIGFIW
ncbi:MAG: AAA family ATPase [Mariprofundaceae bacterium]